jgi:rod shape-determining protein MreC
MKELLRILIKFHRIFIFILLEIICLSFIVSNDHFHKSVYLSSANTISGSIYEATNSISSFFNLKDINENLLLENSELRNKIQHNDSSKDSVFLYSNKKYLYRYAKVINKSVNKLDNSITLNKGLKDGVKKEMAVISYQGVVGIVSNVSEHYSTVLPIINQSLSLSAKIKRNNFFGSLTWDNKSYKKAILKDIPFHANVMKGDTIITSGYSAIFPEGILIALIDSHKHENGNNFLSINVNLSVDFKTLENVYIIENLYKEEQKELESEK